MKCIFIGVIAKCVIQGSYRSGKTGKSQGFCVVGESLGKVMEKYYF